MAQRRDFTTVRIPRRMSTKVYHTFRLLTLFSGHPLSLTHRKRGACANATCTLPGLSILLFSPLSPALQSRLLPASDILPVSNSSLPELRQERKLFVLQMLCGLVLRARVPGRALEHAQNHVRSARHWKLRFGTIFKPQWQRHQRQPGTWLLLC